MGMLKVTEKLAALRATTGPSNADAYVLLADEYRLTLGLVRNSRDLAEQMLRMFLAEGKIDRHDGQDRYRLLLLHVKPGGGLSSDDREFWWSDTERRVCCEIKPWDSSAVWTGPVLEEQQGSLGRQTAEIHVWGIRFHHAKYVEFLRGKGFHLPEDQPPQAAESEEDAVPAAKPCEPTTRPQPAQTAGNPSVEDAVAKPREPVVRTRRDPAEPAPGSYEEWVRDDMKREPPDGPCFAHKLWMRRPKKLFDKSTEKTTANYVSKWRSRLGYPPARPQK